MDKDVRIHIGILLSHKKEWHNAIAVAQIDLEMIILSEISQRQMSYAITYMWGLKYDRNEPISDTKTGQRTFSWFLRGKWGWRGEGLGVWDYQMQTAIYRMDKQQGLIAEHRELFSIPCNKPQWKSI